MKSFGIISVVSLSFLLLFARSTRANEPSASLMIPLNGDWRVHAQDLPEVIFGSINFTWKNSFDIPEGDVSVQYNKNFEIKETINQATYLVIPPSWIRIKILINEIMIADAHDYKIKGNIFEHHVLSIPAGILKKGLNTISILSIGNIAIGGFRSDNCFLTNNRNDLRHIYMLNFFLNDIHNIFSFFCTLISILAIYMGFNMRDKRRKDLFYLFIACTSVMPYNLLMTGFYEFFRINIESSIKLNIMFQTLAIPCFANYFLINGNDKRMAKFMLPLKYAIFLLGISPLAYYAISLVSFSVFLKYCTLLIAFQLLYCPILVMATRYNGLVFLVSSFTALTGIASIGSDLMGWNIYFAGYGFFATAMICVYTLVKDFLISSFTQASLTEVVQAFVPGPIFGKIEIGVKQGLSIAEIRKDVSGFTTISNVFVDICEWGVMSDDLPKNITIETREETIKFVSRLFGKHELVLIKTIGDSMHFVCGLSNDSRLSDVDISNSTLTAIVNLLKNIDTLNVYLKEKRLPSICLKISATIGTCYHSLEGYEDSLRFDVQGHWINVVKRFEESMDKDFYSKYGKNVSLVSKTLVILCSELALRKRFNEAFIVKDKHDKQYEAFIGKQYEDQIDNDKFLDGLYGQFSHGK